MKKLFIILLFLPLLSTGQKVYNIGGTYQKKAFIETNVNSAPSVSLSFPTNGGTLLKDTGYTISGAALDFDGEVDSAWIDLNGMYLAHDLTDPYRFEWTPTSTGTYQIQMFAIDDGNEIGASNLISVSVVNAETVGDSTFVEAEHMTMIGSYGPSYRSVASNDSIMNLLNDSRGVEYTLLHPIDKLVVGIIGNNTQTQVQVNGADSVVITNPGDNIYVYPNEVNLVADSGDIISMRRLEGYPQIDYGIFLNNWSGEVSTPGGGSDPVPDPEPNDTTDYFSLSDSTINENYPAGTYIGTLSGSAGYQVDHEMYDGWFFQLKGDSLLSRMAFNRDAFIGSNLSNSHPLVEIKDSAGRTEAFRIQIIGATGKWDQNGYADQEMATFYENLGDSSLRVGDYLIFNWSNKSGWVSEAPVVEWPNQIKIMSGYYKEFHFDLSQATGNNTKQPVIVTNWLGQVEYRASLYLNNCQACRLTSEYDPVKKTGNKYFTASIHDPWKYRKFGIFRDVESLDSPWHGIAVRGSGMTKIEIDHIEIMGGHYDGINFKDDNAGGGIVDSSYVHDCYLHDLNNEGLYMGNTKSIAQYGPQQFFTNTVVENNLFVRCGSEGYQFQRGTGNNVFRNNVVWSGLVWLNPFQNYQFGNQQMLWANGGNTHKDEIFMGSTGDNAALIKPKAGEDLPYNGNPNTIKNSLYYCMRGNGGLYMNLGGVDDFPEMILDSLYFGHTGLNFGIINNQYDPTEERKVVVIENWPSPLSMGYFFYDNSIATPPYSDWNNRNPTSAVQQAIPAPVFQNAFGADTGSLRVDSIHRWSHWYPIIWNDTKGKDAAINNGFRVGETMVFKPHDVVQHWTPKANRWFADAAPVRLYYCLEQHLATDIEPGVTPGWEEYWKLLTWETPEGHITFIPPDDFDLEADTEYDLKGMGLQE